MKVDMSSSKASRGRRKPAITVPMTPHLHFGVTTTRASARRALTSRPLRQVITVRRVLIVGAAVVPVDTLQGRYRRMRKLLLAVLGPPSKAVLTRQRSLNACIEAAFMVIVPLLRVTSPLNAPCEMETHLARTLRFLTLLSPIGPKALVFIRSASLLNLIFPPCNVLNMCGAKRSFVAGVVIEFPTPEQIARQALPLSLRALWPKQGGTGNLLKILRTLVKAILGPP